MPGSLLRSMRASYMHMPEFLNRYKRVLVPQWSGHAIAGKVNPMIFI